MKLTPPLSLSLITQKFGENQVNYESIDGTIGHPGQDYLVPWGTPIPAAIDAIVSSILSKDNPNLMAFRAVNTIYDESDNLSYEIQYGHCSSIVTTVGQQLKTDTVVANVGNTGEVFVAAVGGGFREVTETEKEAGSHLGAHLHFQVRVLKKESASLPMLANGHYLNDGSGLLTLNGFRYLIPNWNNGYNGCVDPSQFFDILPDPAAPFIHTFSTSLSLGGSGSEVLALQKALQTLKSASGAPYMAPGVFGPYGPQTEAALGRFQLEHGIPDSPQGHDFGPLSRAAVNKALNG